MQDFGRAAKGLIFERRRRVLPVMVVALAVSLGACGATPTPRPSESLRPPVETSAPQATVPSRSTPVPGSVREASAGERQLLGRIGAYIDPSDPVSAVDLPGVRTLIFGKVRASSVPLNSRSGLAMVVTDGKDIAVVTCAWDGSKALGVDTGEAGREAVQLAKASYGDKICTPWITTSSSSR